MRPIVLLLICGVAVTRAASTGYDYDRNNGGGGGDGGRGGSVGDGGNTGNGIASEPIANAPVEYSKEFYSYAAPDGEFNDGGAASDLANSLKQNLRVIFIRGPESSGLENAALQLAQAATDDRTAIYVLNKQTDLSTLADKLSTLNKQSASKPEVHFVKYRTEADANNAQHTIQAQYNNLNGPSTSYNGGIAPVLNFASPVQQAQQQPQQPQHQQPQHQQHQQQQQQVAPQANIGEQYLPPNRRF